MKCTGSGIKSRANLRRAASGSRHSQKVAAIVGSGICLSFNLLIAHMDSLSQIALGAAVGEATLGRKMGRTAAAWGAFFGTLPDLDVLANPFLDAVQSLAFHRSVSHSFLFALLAAPLFGLLLQRLYRQRAGDISWKDWARLVWWCIVTHFLLDLFTVYGTQIFWPFTDHPFGLDAVFIIDPLYTVPLLGCVTVAIVSRRRRNAVVWGLVLSTSYLAWSLTAKTIADRAFETAFEAAGLKAERTMSTPAPLNTLLWSGYAQSGDSLWVATYSLFDDGPPDEFAIIPRRSGILAGHESDRGVARLDWFSKGWWIADSTETGLAIMDPRFGRSDLFLSEAGTYTFRFDLIPDASGRYDSFSELSPDVEDAGGMFSDMMERMFTDR